ncbi:MAG: hypothetical protein CMO80_24245 [Verrucomicrobiales bacterium]|nr:hypothetical protein [Verrucomicrobiales bacterium]|tara:strand:+ start:10230 stop:10550 length:321 start_codon:yes stop_codon:yes gene_type:complete
MSVTLLLWIPMKSSVTTALSRNHCRVFLTGGIVGEVFTDDDQLLLATPANRRIDAYHVTVALRPMPAKDLAPLTNPKFGRGVLKEISAMNSMARISAPIRSEDIQL